MQKNGIKAKTRSFFAKSENYLYFCKKGLDMVLWRKDKKRKRICSCQVPRRTVSTESGNETKRVGVKIHIQTIVEKSLRNGVFLDGDNVRVKNSVLGRNYDIVISKHKVMEAANKACAQIRNEFKGRK